jgi:quercetin dioxygenase-like cupin family protein
MRFAACSVLLVVLVAGPALQSAHAQDAGKPMYTASATDKFVNLPGLPACTTAVVLNGDPSKGGSLMLVKVVTGCVIPWHWHTPTEVLMFVSGHGKGEMKGSSAPIMLHPGDYLSMPGKGVHQFTCVSACTFFLTSDGAFDIHYVDASGKEIPPDQALKSKAKTPAKKEMNDMKDMKM